MPGPDEATPIRVLPEESLADFASEDDPEVPVADVAVRDEAEPVVRPRTRLPIYIGAGVAAVAVIGALVWAFVFSAGGPADGSLRVESDPGGASVQINGALRGVTPLTLTLAPGHYEMRVDYRGRTQTIPVNISQRAETIHHITWPQADAGAAAAAAAPTTGALQILTDPAGATVEVDGTARGLSPVSIRDLSVGEHEVLVRSGGAVHRRTVRVDAGSSASLVISGTPAASASGWMEVTAALPLQILEGGRVIGTTEASKVMLPVGRHDLEFAADAFGFRSRKSVEIGPGRTTAVSVALERVPLSVNATPWAEVWIDGTRVGETPMAAVMTTIGPHDVEFRHPELGRKVVPVRITLKEPARVSVDMRTR